MTIDAGLYSLARPMTNRASPGAAQSRQRTGFTVRIGAARQANTIPMIFRVRPSVRGLGVRGWPHEGQDLARTLTGTPHAGQIVSEAASGFDMKEPRGTEG